MARPFDLQFAVDSGAAAADKAICRCAMILLPAPIICLDFNFTALGNEYCVDLRGPELHLLDPLIESDQSQSCILQPEMYESTYVARLLYPITLQCCCYCSDLESIIADQFFLC